MKVVCERDKLLSVFQTAATVVPSRSPKPILRNIKMVAEKESAMLLATDTEVGIRLDLSGIETTTPGSVILPVGRFGSILRESSDENLSVETDGNSIVVKGQRSEFKLPAENADEFPEVAKFEEEKYHQVSVRLLKELVKRTLFATDNESSRFALGGVLLIFEPTRILAIGTDGRRLAKMEGPAQSVNDHQTGEAMTIVPARAMQLIDRALVDDDSEIRIAARANDILIQSSNATIYARLVEGRYPKWQDVVRERPNSEFIDLTVGPFFSAIRQAAIVASEESRGIDFRFGDGLMVLTGSTAEVGKSRVEIPIAYTGSAVEVSLDHRFVGDFLKVLGSEVKVVAGVKDNDQPADFKTDDGYHYVVMPLTKDAR